MKQDYMVYSEDEICSYFGKQLPKTQCQVYSTNIDVYLLPSEMEASLFSPSQQRKRRRLASLLDGRDLTDIIIHSFQKKTRHSLPHLQDPDSFRGSRFRGISKNGRNSWQVLVMVNRQKKYVGAIYDEMQAARVYDRITIQYQGVGAKTNFSYTKDELIAILKSRPLLD